jgi:hypothetical protein
MATGRHAETPRQKQLSRGAGTTNPPLSTPLSLTLSLSLVRGDRQTRRTAPHSRLVSKIVVKVARRGAPPKPQTTTKARIISLLPPRASRLHRSRSSKLSPAPSFDIVPHQKISTVLKSPATIHCRPSLLWLQMLQAPSSDAVPHRTGECQATSAAAERCKRSSQQMRRYPQTPAGE